MDLKKNRKRVLSRIISMLIITLILSLAVSADIGDSLANAFGTILALVVGLGNFIHGALIVDNVRRSLFFVFGVLFFYAVYHTALGFTPLFKDDGSKKMKKLVAVSLAVISLMGLYWLVPLDQALETFGTLGIFVLSAAFGSGMIGIAHQLNPEGGGWYKTGAFLVSAGLIFYLFGSWLEDENAELGLAFLVLGVLILVISSWRGNSTGGGSGILNILGNLWDRKPNIFSLGQRGLNKGVDIFNDRHNRRYNRWGDHEESKDHIKHTRRLINEYEVRKNNEDDHIREMRGFAQQTQRLVNNLHQFVNQDHSLNDIMRGLTGNDGAETALNSMLHITEQKELRYDKKDKKNDRRMRKFLIKISSDIDEDMARMRTTMSKIEKYKDKWNDEQRNQAEDLYENYQSVVQHLESRKRIVDILKRFDLNIEHLHIQNYTISKKKKETLKKLISEIKSEIDLLENINKKRNRGEDISHLQETVTRKIRHIKDRINRELGWLMNANNEEEHNLGLLENNSRHMEEYLRELRALLESEENVNEHIENIAGILDQETIQSEVENERRFLEQFQSAENESGRIEQMVASQNANNQNPSDNQRSNEDEQMTKEALNKIDLQNLKNIENLISNGGISNFMLAAGRLGELIKAKEEVVNLLNEVKDPQKINTIKAALDTFNGNFGNKAKQLFDSADSLFENQAKSNAFTRETLGQFESLLVKSRWMEKIDRLKNLYVYFNSRIEEQKKKLADYQEVAGSFDDKMNEAEKIRSDIQDKIQRSANANSLDYFIELAGEMGEFLEKLNSFSDETQKLEGMKKDQSIQKIRDYHNFVISQGQVLLSQIRSWLNRRVMSLSPAERKNDYDILTRGLRRFAWMKDIENLRESYFELENLVRQNS
ncbi:MAG: hypothetical protein ACLFUO_06855 [Candidatus Woesearchaeota archaeon]